jgi:hypothetical protein
MKRPAMLASNATLEVVPDTDGQRYEFYIWQVVTFTATLTVPGGIADGQTVIFQSVGTKNQAFVLFGPHDADTTPNNEFQAWQVKAHSRDSDLSVATATIRALYSSVACGADAKAIFEAKSIDSQMNETPSPPYNYTATAPNVNIQQGYDSYQLLPASSDNETPLSSSGNYFICSAYVSDPQTGLPLKNINMRLSPEASHSFDGVRFYPALNSTITDAIGDNKKRQVDRLTDESGGTSIYVCAAQTHGTYAGVIHGKCGVVETQVSTFVIPDFKFGATPSLPAPLLTSSPVQVPSTSPIESIDCTIPAYTNNATDDWIFVLCNRRAQRVEHSSFPRDQTGSVSASFSKFGLRNLTFDDYGSNELTYIVLPAEQPAVLASTLRFHAKGNPGPEIGLTAGTLKAPTIVETLGHGVVINTETIAHGLTVRVPVGNRSPDIPWNNIRYVVNVMLEVSGWMTDVDDPVAVRIISPLDREVSKADIALGYVDIWLPRIEFWGFGQSIEGAMGRCDVQYTMSVIDSFVSPLPKILNRQVDAAHLYRSQVLHCHIDTLPPSGLGPYFD